MIYEETDTEAVACIEDTDDVATVMNRIALTISWKNRFLSSTVRPTRLQISESFIVKLFMRVNPDSLQIPYPLTSSIDNVHHTLHIIVIYLKPFVIDRATVSAMSLNLLIPQLQMYESFRFVARKPLLLHQKP